MLHISMHARACMHPHPRPRSRLAASNKKTAKAPQKTPKAQKCYLPPPLKHKNALIQNRASFPNPKPFSYRRLSRKLRQPGRALPKQLLKKKKGRTSSTKNGRASSTIFFPCHHRPNKKQTTTPPKQKKNYTSPAGDPGSMTPTKKHAA